MSKSLKKHYFILHKPYGYLCQFTGEQGDLLLKDLYPFPNDVYSIGRLDKDSEGLLLMTNDNDYKTKILSPNTKTKKVYWVQVDGQITDEAIATLESGTIQIKHNGKLHRVAPAKCRRMDPPEIPDRVPPIRFRKNIPTSWIELTLTEGKNRQVRRMTAAAGFPTLRLIRYQVDNLSIHGMNPGDVREFEPFTA